MTKIKRNTHQSYLSACPAGAGVYLRGTRPLPQALQDSMQMTQPSVRKRRRLAVFRTINCREQLISAQGCLERVLKTANRLRLMARRFSRTRFHPTRRGNEGLVTCCKQRSWNSQLVRWIPEVPIDGFGTFTAFSDGPYDERLTPSHVACGEDTWDTRAVGVGVRGYVLASIEFDSELFDKTLMHGTHESRCQQNEIGPDF